MSLATQKQWGTEKFEQTSLHSFLSLSFLVYTIIQLSIVTALLEQFLHLNSLYAVMEGRGGQNNHVFWAFMVFQLKIPACHNGTSWGGLPSGPTVTITGLL